MKYTLQYASNFFLNLQKKRDFQSMLKPSCENLALLGNIGALDTPSSLRIYKDFLTYVSYNWKETYVVPGPYELTSKSPKVYNKCLEELHTLNLSYDNLRVLNNSHVIIPGTDIQLIGSTLWSRRPYLRHQCMFEYAHIWLQGHQGLRNIMGEDIVNWHEEDVLYIKNMLKNNYRSIVLTHHLPHTILHNDISRVRMDSSNLEDMLHKPIEYWLSGAGNTSIRADLGYSADVCCATNPYTSFNDARNEYGFSYNPKASVSLRITQNHLV
jgi:hypothetical protein